MSTYGTVQWRPTGDCRLSTGLEECAAQAGIVLVRRQPKCQASTGVENLFWLGLHPYAVAVHVVLVLAGGLRTSLVPPHRTHTLAPMSGYVYVVL